MTDLTIQNGVLTTTADANLETLVIAIANANLTISDVKLDGSNLSVNPDAPADTRAIRFQGGNLSLEGDTSLSVPAVEGVTAIWHFYSDGGNPGVHTETYDGSNGSAVIDTNGTIEGTVVVTNVYDGSPLASVTADKGGLEIVTVGNTAKNKLAVTNDVGAEIVASVAAKAVIEADAEVLNSMTMLVWQLSNANGVVGTYATLQEAIDNSYTHTASGVDESVPHTITLLADTTGKGAMIASNETYGYGCAKDLTIDLGGYAFTIDEGYRKSDAKPIDDKGIRVAILDRFVMKNGTVNVEAGAKGVPGAYDGLMVGLFDAIQGNGYVELNNVVIDGTNLPKGNTGDHFVVRVGSGAVILTGENSGVKAAEGNAAVYLSHLYDAENPIDITVDDAADITGTIYVANAGTVEAKLVAKTGEFADNQIVYATDEAKDSATVTAAAAYIGNNYYLTLADAIVAAQNGDIILLADGTHTMPKSVVNKNITIKGSKDAIIEYGFATMDYDAIGANGSTIVFEGITIKTDNGNYEGFQHAEKIVYNKCDHYGTEFLYAPVVEFNGVTFYVSGDAYAVWTYGAKDVTFANCEFNTYGKAVLVYTESATKAEIKLSDVTFNSTGVITGKAAVEVGQSANGEKAEYLVSFENCTADKGFTANNSNSNLYGDKNNMGAGNGMAAKVDGELAYGAIIKNETTGVAYYSLTEAIAAANSGDTILVVAAEIELPKITKAGLTFKSECGTKITNEIETTNSDLGWNIAGTTFDGFEFTQRIGLVGKDISILNCQFTGTNGIYYGVASGTWTIDKCVFDCDIYGLQFGADANGTVNVTNSTFYGGFNTYGTIVNMTKCHFIAGKTYNIVQTRSTLTLTDCTFDASWPTGDPEKGYHVGNAVADGVVEIYNTTYAGGSMFDLMEDKSVGIFVVNPTKDENGLYTGGTFATEPPLAYFAPGMGIIKNADGTITVAALGEAGVVAPTAAAAIIEGENIYYASLADAIAAAKAGDTVVLVNDVTTTDLVINKAITLDLNGFTLTGEANQTDYAIIISVADVTIKGGKNGDKKGTIVPGATANAGIDMYSGGTLTLDGVVIDNSQVTGRMSFCIVVQAGTTKLIGGTELIISENLDASPAYNCAIRYNCQDTGVHEVIVDVDDATLNGDIVINGHTDRVVYNMDLAPETVLNNVKFVFTDSANKNYSSANTTVEATADQLTKIGYGAIMNGVGYATLSDAIAALGDSKEATTIELTSDHSGAGIIIKDGQNVTIDFDGYTYTVDGTPLAGSAGTETQAMQLLKGATVTLKNGTLTSTAGSGVKMLIQNYANLTVDNMTLDGRNLDETVNGAPNYTLSINNGNVTINNSTIWADVDGDENFAFDVYSAAAYPDAKTVTVNDSTINGDIEIAAGEGADASKSVLDIENKGNIINGAIIDRVKNMNTHTVVVGGKEYTVSIEGLTEVVIENENIEITVAEDGNKVDYILNTGNYMFNTEKFVATVTLTAPKNAGSGTMVQVINNHFTKAIGGHDDTHVYHAIVDKNGNITIEVPKGIGDFTVRIPQSEEDKAFMLTPEAVLHYMDVDGKCMQEIVNPSDYYLIEARYYEKQDRYAFGVIGYETLSGQHVYASATWYNINDPVDKLTTLVPNPYDDLTYSKTYVKSELKVFDPQTGEELELLLTLAAIPSFTAVDVGTYKNELTFTTIKLNDGAQFPLFGDPNRDFIIDHSKAGTTVITPADITGPNPNITLGGEYTFVDGVYQDAVFPISDYFLSKNRQDITVRFWSDETDSYSLAKAPAFEDAGTYVVKYSVSAPNHYTRNLTYTIKINPAEVTPIWSILDVLTNEDYITQIYDSKTVTVKPSEVVVYFEINGERVPVTLVPGVDFFAFGINTTQTNAGTYDITLIGSGNYRFSDTKSWTIAPRDIKITINPMSIVYGSAIPAQSDYSFTTDTAWAASELTGAVWTTTYNTDAADTRKVGKYDISVAFDANSNFNITAGLTLEDGLEVTKRPIDGTLVYNGRPLYYGSAVQDLERDKFNFVVGTDYSLAEWDENEDFRAAAQALIQNNLNLATSFTNTANADTKHNVQLKLNIFGDNYMFYNSENADLHQFWTGNLLLIEKRPITIIPAVKDGVDIAYGSIFEQDDFTFIYADGSLKVVNGDEINLEYAIDGYEPGSPVAEYTITATESDNPNYAITIVDGSVKIEKRKIILHPREHSVIYGSAYVQHDDPWFYTYDEFGVWNTVFEDDKDEIAQLFTTATDYKIGDNVGDEKYIWIVYKDGKTENDHPNYEIELGFIRYDRDYSKAALTILPNTEVSADEFEAIFKKLTYNTDVQQPTLSSLTIEKLLADGTPLTDIVDVKTMVKVAKATEKYAGTYNITLTITGGNYAGAELTAQYTIKRYVVDSVDWSDNLYTLDGVISNKYDGNEKAPVVTMTLNGETLTFKTNTKKYAGDHEFFVTGLIGITGADDEKRALASYMFNYELIDAGLFEIEERTPVKFYAATVVLGDEYAINFKIKEDALNQYGYTAADKDSILKLTYLGETVRSESFTLTGPKNGYYIVTFQNIAPQNMGKKVKAEFVSEMFLNNPRAKSYSVAEYCYSRIDVYAPDAEIGDAQDENYVFVKALLSMLVYGEAAEHKVYGETTLLTGTKYEEMVGEYGLESVEDINARPTAPKDETSFEPAKPTLDHLEGYNFNLTVGLAASSGNKLSLSYTLPAGVTFANDVRVVVKDNEGKTWLTTEDGSAFVQVKTEADLAAIFNIPLNASAHTFTIYFYVDGVIAASCDITLDMFVTSIDAYATAEALKQFGTCLDKWHELVAVEAETVAA